MSTDSEAGSDGYTIGSRVQRPGFRTDRALASKPVAPPSDDSGDDAGTRRRKKKHRKHRKSHRKRQDGGADGSAGEEEGRRRRSKRKSARVKSEDGSQSAGRPLKRAKREPGTAVSGGAGSPGDGSNAGVIDLIAETLEEFEGSGSADDSPLDLEAEIMSSTRAKKGGRRRKSTAPEDTGKKANVLLPTDSKVELIDLSSDEGEVDLGIGSSPARRRRRVAGFERVGQADATRTKLQPRTRALLDKIRDATETNRAVVDSILTDSEDQSSDADAGASETLVVLLRAEKADASGGNREMIPQSKLKIRIEYSASPLTACLKTLLAHIDSNHPIEDCTILDRFECEIEPGASAKDHGVANNDELVVLLCGAISPALEDSFKYDEDDESDDDSPGGERVRLKLRFEDKHKKEKTYTIGMNDPLSKIIDAFSDFMEMDADSLRFDFDGDILEGDQTPADLDMEDDDLIDVSKL